VAALGAGLIAPAPIALRAQSVAAFDTPLAGGIDAPGATQSWTFVGAEGAVVSILVTGEGEFDPALALASSAGRALIANDDFAYPGRRDALVQAITLPRTDTYTVTVSGFGDSVGAYTLLLSRGYAESAATDDFETSGRAWSSVGSALSVEQVAGGLTLSLSGVNQSGFAVGELALPDGDYYVRADLSNVGGRSGWIVGLVVRRQGGRYYQLSLNQAGQWRLTFHESGGARVVRDWTNHPAIRAGEASFSLAVLANGGGFDAFYNDFYIGQAIDEAYIAPNDPSGEVGLALGTPNIAGGGAVAEFDNLLVTRPLRLGEAELIPDQLMAGALGLTIQELERRRVIAPGGAQALTVPESIGQLNDIGVQRVMLARSTTFGAMVFGTNFTLTAGDGTVGCGLLFGHTDENNFTLAFLDQRGGYGLSRRSGSGFSPGLFGERDDPAWRTGRQEIIVVVLAERAHLYINRRYAGQFEAPLIEGEVGNAVVNYEPLNTTCRFTDTWAWRLE
jgi:hypothetical protein